jgi:hypothetical protein
MLPSAYILLFVLISDHAKSLKPRAVLLGGDGVRCFLSHVISRCMLPSRKRRAPLLAGASRRMPAY